jgi:hypothetical protein
MNMASVHYGIIYGLAGIIIGASSLKVMTIEENQLPINDDKKLVEILSRINQLEMMIREMRGAISASTTQTFTGNEKILSPHAFENKVVTSISTITSSEDTNVKNILKHLHQPGYVYSTTLPVFMQTDDMAKLSPEAREKIVSEMVGMMNRGEIDVKTFMGQK